MDIPSLLQNLSSQSTSHLVINYILCNAGYFQNRKLGTKTRLLQTLNIVHCPIPSLWKSHACSKHPLVQLDRTAFFNWAAEQINIFSMLVLLSALSIFFFLFFTFQVCHLCLCCYAVASKTCLQYHFDFKPTSDSCYQ